MSGYHFEFNQWEEAFRFFYDRRLGYDLKNDAGDVLGFRKGNPKLVFVISTSDNVSGYWIEEGAEADDETTVYRSVKSVRKLEKRVRLERESTVNLSLGKVVT